MKAHVRQSRSNILPLEAIMTTARSLANREAHTPDDVDDLIQVGLFAYHKAEERHRHLNLIVDKPHALARVTLQRAMRGYYWQQREWQKRGEPNKSLALDHAGGMEDLDVGFMPSLAVGLTGQSGTGESPELMEFDDFFNALEKKCGPTARLIVENLLMPSGECCGRILDEVRGKQAVQAELKGKKAKVRARQPRGVKKTIRISHRTIRDAMQISPTEWVRQMGRIREFTQAWIGR